MLETSILLQAGLLLQSLMHSVIEINSSNPDLMLRCPRSEKGCYFLACMLAGGFYQLEFQKLAFPSLAPADRQVS